MGQVAKALGLGSEFEFKGQSYKLSPWSYKIQGHYERYLESEAVKVLQRLRPYLSDQEYKDQLGDVRRDIVNGEYTFGSESVAKTMTSLPHLKQLLFLMLLENHPEIKKDLVEEMIQEELDRVLETMSQANADPTLLTPTPAPPS